MREDKATGLITVIKTEGSDHENGSFGSPNRFIDALKEDSIDQKSVGSALRSTKLSQNSKSKKKSRGKKVKIRDEEEEYFDPSAYKFKKPDYNYQQEMYKQRFMTHLDANKAEINKQLVELCYFQVLNRMKKEGEVSDISDPINFNFTFANAAKERRFRKKLILTVIST